jgi:glycosyltransferase involved in cell wall biosynthesis
MSKHEAKRKKKWKDKLTWTVNAWIHALLLPKNLIHLSNFSFALSSHPKNGNEIIIPNAVTPRFFDIQTKTTFNNRLLYVGIIDNNKNIRLTLRLMHALKQKGIIYHLDVMGGFSDQAFENSIKNNIIEWGLEKQVHFHGWVNQSQIIDQLSISDILVVSSFHESLPMVIAEARASGKVVLAVRVGGIPEMIRDGIDGFLFDHGNEELAIEKLKYLSQHPHHAIEMANKAKQHATEHLHSSIIAQKTLEFYRTILS